MADQNNSEQQKKVKLSRESLREAVKIFVFVRPYRWYIISGLIMLFFTSMIFMVIPFLSGQMVDIAQGNSRLNLSLKQVGGLFAIVLIIQGILAYSRVMVFAIASEKGIADVRKALYNKIISLPIVFFEENRIGDIVSRLTADVEKLYNAFSVTLAEFLRQVLILIAGIVFLAITTPRLALIMLATFPLIVVGAMVFGRYIRRLSKERQDQLADTNIILSETTQSINSVKTFTNEAYESGRYRTSIQSVIKIALKFAQGRAIFSVFIVSILFGALFFILWQGAMMVQSGVMTAGDLIAFVAYTAIIGGAIAGLGNFYANLLGAIGATERIREILTKESEVEIEQVGKIKLDHFSGDIQYKDVHFSYPTRKDVPVLKGINMEIHPGQKIALVGASGSGKSTIVALLMHFYKIEEGSIMVDGININDYDVSAYRGQMAIVPQEVLLFGGTIRENIAYGKPKATEDEIIEAARLSNSYDFIMSFPEGLETIVGERGVKLSGGQRQRIAIARAILKDPRILLLDEATSSLDAESEKVVQEAMDRLMEGRTSIIIAHRLATIRNVDCIYVIDDGKIVEQGTHDELSQLEDGVYNALAKLQFETDKVLG